ncbi:uncharacterized protein LOC108631817 [Ceratina calcarata]|uniref:Uncharacterized protein LOC108631817 n=1 Tax=Ceratina calcarata TaxID=156304 RepID=A0AAJ7JEA7_9HYME|nr:uncharacterized protein LOC108631817 [Ceratina calcarata]
MDQNEYIEVRIFESVGEIPNAEREYSIKTLSTIPECDTSKVSRNKQSSNSKPIIESYTRSKKKPGSPRATSVPLDIDLLLRYYACNSSMEKSINQVLARSNDQVCKDTDQSPLLELGAAYKICNSLKESASRNSLLSTFRFHDILNRLQSMVRRCSRETLNEILSNDPTMKICEHCGVISCSKQRGVSVDSRTSPPKTSYFLSTQLFPDIASSGDDKSEMQYKRRLSKDAKRRNDLLKDGNAGYQKRWDKERRGRGMSLSIDRDNDLRTSPQQVEIMVAERENDSETQGTCSTQGATTKEEDRLESQDQQIRNSQTGKTISKGKAKSGASHQPRIVSNCEEGDKAKSDTAANVTSTCLREGYFNSVDYKREFLGDVSNNKRNEWRTSSRERPGVKESGERVVRDVLYENPKSRFDNLIEKICASANDGQAIESKQSTTDAVRIPSADVMSYLASGQFRSMDRGKKDFVSQLDYRSCARSRRDNNRSFVLHNERDCDPCPNSEFLMCHKLMPSGKVVNSSKMLSKSSLNYAERPRHVESSSKAQEFKSFTYLMEEDSLENCVKPSSGLEQANESNTTLFSSSSAENMIRKWVKAPRGSKESSVYETYKSSYTSKPSAIGLDAGAFRTNETCGYCMLTNTLINGQSYLQAHSTNQMTGNNTKFDRPSIAKDFKAWTSRESIKNKTSVSNSKKNRDQSKKSFKRQILTSLRSIKSLKLSKSKDIEATAKSPSNSSLSDHVKTIFRRIFYRESSFKDMANSNERFNKTNNVLSLYRKVLEGTERMDWPAFQQFVENLHPDQKKSWREICKSINDEVKRVAGEEDGYTEICIEIASVPSMGYEGRRGERSNEIVFEMDITLGDVERCLGRQLPYPEKEQLAALERASEFANVRNDDVCDTEVASNQAE